MNYHNYASGCHRYNNMEVKATKESFVIAWEDNKQKDRTLQNAFLKFKQERKVSDCCAT